MNYVKSVVEGVAEIYPYNIYQLRLDNPNVSFPEYGMDAMSTQELAEYNAYVVIDTPPPDIDPETESLVSNCAFIDGEWVQVWFVVPK